MKLVFTLVCVIQITFGLLFVMPAFGAEGSAEPIEIYNVQIVALSESEVEVTWNTNIPTQGFIFYAEEDTSSGFPMEAMEPFEYVSTHALTLSSLSLTANYYFIIDQSDIDWNNQRAGTFSFVIEDLLNSNHPIPEHIQYLEKLITTPQVEENVAFVDGAFLSKDVVYIVDSENKLYKTADGGQTWADISPETNFPSIVGATPRVSFINENIGAVSFSVDDGGNNYNYDVVYGNVYCTTDGGVTWSDAFAVNNDQVKHLQQVSETVLYISGAASFGVSSSRWFKKITRDASSGIYTLSDIALMPTDRPHVQAGAWLSESFGVVIGQLNVEPYTPSIFKTTDGGASWTKLRDIATTSTMHSFFSLQSDKSIKIFDESNFIVSTYRHDGTNYISELLITDDGGTSWTTMNPCVPNPTSLLVNLYLSDAGDGLMGGFTADDTIAQPFYYSQDFGQNWSEFKLPNLQSPIWINDVETTDDGCTWAIGSYGSIWKSGAAPVIAPPIGDSLQIFAAGSTIDELIVEGENLTWYDAPTGGTILGPTTFLVDGTTYYATQTIDGIESVNRLAIKVSIVNYSADFVSVKDGNWSEPSTWSFDTNATAIPNANSNVLIKHQVSIQTNADLETPTCYDVQVLSNGRIYGYGSYYTSPNLTVHNDFTNYGILNWYNDCVLTIEGNFYNHGRISGDESYNFNINLYGDLINSGSFRAVGHATSYFTNGINLKGANGHKIHCLNDSIIYSRYILVDDPDGWMEIDSLANFSCAIRLGGQGLMMNYHDDRKAQLKMNSASIFGGIVYANGNEIVSNSGANTLGKFYDNPNDLEIHSAVIQGNFQVDGTTNPNYGGPFVIFDGETVLYGDLYNWYTNSTYSGGDRGMVFKGSFLNYGAIRDTPNTANGHFCVNQMDGSELINYGELSSTFFKVHGDCSWVTFDTISVSELYASGDTSSLNMLGELLFDETVKIDFAGSDLNLQDGAAFKTDYQWYNAL